MHQVDELVLNMVLFECLFDIQLVFIANSLWYLENKFFSYVHNWLKQRSFGLMRRKLNLILALVARKVPLRAQGILINILLHNRIHELIRIFCCHLIRQLFCIHNIAFPWLDMICLWVLTNIIRHPFKHFFMLQRTVFHWNEPLGGRSVSLGDSWHMVVVDHLSHMVSYVEYLLSGSLAAAIY